MFLKVSKQESKLNVEVSEGRTVQVQEFIRIIRLMLYWVLPPVILYIIFSRIDFEQLIEIVAKANAELLFIGIAVTVCKIITGGFRWYLLTIVYGCTRLTLWRSIAEYWISLTLGIIVPGSLGSDAYRIALGGRQTVLYLRRTFVIGIEKLAALFSCATFVVGLYPFLLIETLPDTVTFTFDAAYFFLMFGVPAEIALVVSFCGLFSVMLGHAIGAILIFLRRRQVSVKHVPVQ